MFGRTMRRCSLALMALATSASVAVAQPDSDAERLRCQGVARDWAPVKLPPAGVEASIPCNDRELSAYKNANAERKRTDGIGGCERAGRTFTVIYFVNAPAGFFNELRSKWKPPEVQDFQVAGHRVFRAGGLEDGEAHGEQLIEIDASRLVLMSSHSKISRDASFSDITSCFFNTLHVVKP